MTSQVNAHSLRILLNYLTEIISIRCYSDQFFFPLQEQIHITYLIFCF